jgi:hypothetical protein
MGNYVIAVGNYVIVSPSELGNCVIADSHFASLQKATPKRHWVLATSCG